MKKYLLLSMFFVLGAGVAFGGGVTNTPGVRVIDILDNTQTGVNGDEPSIGYVSYSQVSGNLLIDVHVIRAPASTKSFLPCTLSVELVTERPDGRIPDDWATGGIGEDTGGQSGHFGIPNLLGSITITSDAIAGVASFVRPTTEFTIEGAQQPAGLRNYGHINLEQGEGRCGLELNQVGASRMEWITTRE
jgi:hypothetical protein